MLIFHINGGVFLMPIPYHFELFEVSFGSKHEILPSKYATFALETTLYSVLPSRISKCSNTTRNQ